MLTQMRLIKVVFFPHVLVVPGQMTTVSSSRGQFLVNG